MFVDVRRLSLVLLEQSLDRLRLGNCRDFRILVTPARHVIVPQNLLADRLV